MVNKYFIFLKKTDIAAIFSSLFKHKSLSLSHICHGAAPITDPNEDL